MSALEAARLGDQIGHTCAMKGLLAGLVVGFVVTGLVLLAVGATVATGGAAAVVIGGLIAGTAAGGLSGMKIGATFDSDPMGPISTGSPNTFLGTGARPAARAIKDTVLCASHDIKFIAQGSTNVFINKAPAARRSDGTVCSAKIREGQPDVFFGGPTGTYLDMESEVPGWLVTTLQWAAIVGTVIATGGAILTVGFGAAMLGLGGSMLGGWAGGKIGGAIGEALGGARGEAIGEALGSFGGSLLGGMAGSREGPLEEPGARVEEPGARLEEPTTAPEEVTAPREPSAAEEPSASREPSAEEPSGAREPGSGEEPGTSSEPAPSKCGREGEPVDVASGAVVDEQTDVALPGAFPCIWRRSYSSKRAKQRTTLGRGGWGHSFEQWIEVRERVIALHAEDGRDVYFAAISPGQSTFHKQERLTLTALPGGAFTVHSLDTRLTREFAPIVGGERAVLRAIRDAHQNAVTLEYSGRKLKSIVDTAGREVRVKLDGAERVVRLEVWVDGALDLWFDYAYAPHGELERATDALGNAERYDYDEDHRMVKKTRRNGVAFHYVYDEATGWCVRTWGDGEIHHVELRPDFAARTTLTTGNETPWIYTWNEEGAIVRKASLDGSFVWTRVFDDDLQLIEATNGAGEQTRYEYDARGNRTQIVDPAGNVTRWAYEDDQPVVKVAPDGLVTRFTHDERGDLSGVTYPSGLSYALIHDRAGLLREVRGAEGTVASFDYDARHNIAAETDARGVRMSYEHDALGRPTARIDASRRRVAVHYDREGNPLTITYADGTSVHAEFDALGNVVRYTDALQQTTALEYAGTGTLVRVVEAGGGTYRFSYDGAERLRSIQNPLSERYGFHYDGAGRLAREETFDGRTIGYAYSAASRVSRVDYPDGTWRDIAYDPLGNVVGDRSPDATIRFERDRLGRLRLASVDQGDELVTTTLERDALGRVSAELQGSQRIGFEYDRQGRRVARVMPDGSTTRYLRDRAGSLVAVEHDGRRMTVERDALGREIRRAAGSGRVAIESAYDGMDRLVERRASALGPGGAAASTLSRRQWAHDESGRVLRVEDDRWGTAQYEHDRIGRLISAKRGERLEVFEYDAAGSLKNMLRDLDRLGEASSWQVQQGNLLTSTGDARYAYDRRGRRVEKVLVGEGEQTTRYVWDSLDHLREIELPGGDRLRFTYDAFGRRVRKDVIEAASGANVAQRTVAFLWDGDALAAEADSARPARTFVHEPGTLELMLQAEQGAVFAVVNDHLGTPKELIDVDDGRVAWSATHSAWGIVTDRAVDPGARFRVETPFRLLGHYEDEETGLRCTRFRYFDAEVGRWCSPDPLGVRAAPNLFAFDGSPVANIDPLGLIDPKLLPQIPDTPGVYHVEAGGKVYTGSAGKGEDTILDRVTDPDHPARALFDAPDAKITTYEVDLGTADTGRMKNHILRGYEQNVMDAKGNVALSEDPSSNSVNKIRAAASNRTSEFQKDAKDSGASMKDPTTCG